MSHMTRGQLAAWIVELGLGDARALERVLSSRSADEPCEDAYGLLGMLNRFGVLCLINGETLFRVRERGVSPYREQLNAIAAASRGRLTITDVELGDIDGAHVLRFRCNAAPHAWRFPHGPPEDYEAFGAFADHIGELVPSDSRERWCWVDPTFDDETVFVLGDPEALRQLGDRFGATFEPC